MFQNNNGKVIRHLSKRCFAANKSRNVFAIFALTLTTLLITSVFSIGVSYIKTNEQQQLRMMGTTAHAAITNVRAEQIEELSNKNGFVSTIGVSHRLGRVESEAKDMRLGLVWLDDAEWKNHRLPTISGVKGNYPIAQNEVMLPTWVLGEMGISTPNVGMEIPLVYALADNENLQTGNFVLSGYYTDYMQVRTGNKGMVYVSEVFRQETGIPLQNGGAAMISFINDEKVAAYAKQIENGLPLDKNQTLEMVPLYAETDHSITVTLAGIIVVIITAGYLLIYNILYISVSKDIRSYGQLKTLGATKKQIRRLIRLQVLKISAVGIPIGLLLGAVVSFGVVPLFLSMFSGREEALGISISFSPLIFIGAGIFALLTALLSSMKPAQMAARVSPVEAVKFTGAYENQRKERSSRSGAKVAHMAWRNIFRNGKSAILVFTSLFFGLVLFLLSTGLLGSLSPENFVTENMNSDMTVTVASYSSDDVITEEILSEIGRQRGVEKVRTTLIAAPIVEIPVIYTEETYGKYIKSLANNPEITSNIDFSDPEVVKDYVAHFGSYVYGIDSFVGKLSQVDMEAFEDGELVLLPKISDTDGNLLFGVGQEITLASSQSGEHTYKIGGFLEGDFGNKAERGTAPNIFMSKAALQKLSPNYKIGRLDIETDRKNDGALLTIIESLFNSNSEARITSRYEKEQEIKGFITTCNVLGIGLSVILLLIGVMNFANTMLVSVTTRKQELAVLESIGMTAKQIRKMLVLEGIYCFLISALLMGTLGSVIFLGTFRALKGVATYAVLTYPVMPMLAAASIILVVCVTVPLGAYQTNRKFSVVEGIRQASQ